MSSENQEQGRNCIHSSTFVNVNARFKESASMPEIVTLC